MVRRIEDSVEEQEAYIYNSAHYADKRVDIVAYEVMHEGFKPQDCAERISDTEIDISQRIQACGVRSNDKRE